MWKFQDGKMVLSKQNTSEYMSTYNLINIIHLHDHYQVSHNFDWQYFYKNTILIRWKGNFCLNIDKGKIFHIKIIL